MSKTDGAIPLDEVQKATVGRYMAEIQQLEGMLNVKRQALNDILSAFIAGKGLKQGKYNLDLPTMMLKAISEAPRGPVAVPNPDPETK